MFLELFREACGGLRISGEQDNTRHRPVEPVRHAEVDVARLAVAVFEVRLGPGFERWQAGGDTLGQEWGGLVDCQTVVIFEENNGRHRNPNGTTDAHG